MEDFNSETDSDYTSYWKDWVGCAFHFYLQAEKCVCVFVARFSLVSFFHFRNSIYLAHHFRTFRHTSPRAIRGASGPSFTSKLKSMDLAKRYAA